jgi:hypothetical protein
VENRTPSSGPRKWMQDEKEILADKRKQMKREKKMR